MITYNKGCKVDKVENAVKEALLQYKGELEKSLINLLAKDTSDIEKRLNDTLETLQSDLVNQQKKEKRLKDLYIDGDIDKEEYQKRKKQIEDTITALQNEIAVTKNKLKKLDATAQISRVKSILNMIDNFEQMDLEEQNATLKLLISKIVFTKTVETNNEPVIDIHWREL